jgi:metal transporter CNNM
VAVNAALSILLADLTDGLMGFFLSTALIVIFGEIVPQAVCSRYGLQIGAKII